MNLSIETYFKNKCKEIQSFKMLRITITITITIESHKRVLSIYIITIGILCPLLTNSMHFENHFEFK
jgi:uncharacterized membrane protein (DUF441 family)